VEACAVAVQDRGEHHIISIAHLAGDTGSDRFGHFAY
jgi:hypothetical protein